MIRRLGWASALMLGGALLLTGCSSGPNLAQDQANVNRWMDRVATDTAKVDLAANEADLAFRQNASLAPACLGFQPVANPVACGGADEAAFNRYEAALAPSENAVKVAKSRLHADQFQLQVAQDQLKRDESGG